MLDRTLAIDIERLGNGLVEKVEEMFLDLGRFKRNIVDFFVKILLGIDIEVVVFFALAEKLLSEFVLAFFEILGVLEVLTAQLIHQVDALLEIVFRHLNKINKILNREVL